jgi:hypothetical protein
MNRLMAGALSLVLFAPAVNAQKGLEKNLEKLHIQVHGFATQSIVYSNHDNYLGMNTSDGSADWSEAAVNVNDQLTPRLRAGVQLHYTRLGEFGGDKPVLDWALGDFKVKPWLNVRAGKVKIRWGLYNDTQDYDPGYLWSLLPESIYGLDLRTTNLSQQGVDLYGKIQLAHHLGRIDYSLYYGYYTYASDDGYMAIFKASEIDFVHPPKGKTPGFDFRWATPVTGLKVGGSVMFYDSSGKLTNGSYYQPLAVWPTFYAQYDAPKYFVSAQYMKLVQYQTITVDETDPATSVSDGRGWFAMGGYHLTSKLQAGAYYSHYLLASGGDSSDPVNYSNDWVVSGRYDIHPKVYAKMEGHFIKGQGLGFYSFNNLNELQPKTNLLVAKIGFTF